MAYFTGGLISYCGIFRDPLIREPRAPRRPAAPAGRGRAAAGPAELGRPGRAQTDSSASPAPPGGPAVAWGRRPAQGSAGFPERKMKAIQASGPARPAPHSEPKRERYTIWPQSGHSLAAVLP